MIHRLNTIYQLVLYKSYFLYVAMVSSLFLFPVKALADSPWGGGAGIDPSDLQKTVSDDSISGFKTITIIAGTALLIGAVTAIAKVITRSAEERKDHGSGVMTIIIAVFAGVVGIAFLGIAWKGLSYTPPST